jgi:hypothetical protein
MQPTAQLSTGLRSAITRPDFFTGGGAQIKLAGVAETVGKFGLAVAVACFVAQTIIWLAELGKKVGQRVGCVG